MHSVHGGLPGDIPRSMPEEKGTEGCVFPQPLRTTGSSSTRMDPPAGVGSEGLSAAALGKHQTFGSYTREAKCECSLPTDMA